MEVEDEKERGGTRAKQGRSESLGEGGMVEKKFFMSRSAGTRAHTQQGGTQFSSCTHTSMYKCSPCFAGETTFSQISLFQDACIRDDGSVSTVSPELKVKCSAYMHDELWAYGSDLEDAPRRRASSRMLINLVLNSDAHVQMSLPQCTYRHALCFPLCDFSLFPRSRQEKRQITALTTSYSSSTAMVSWKKKKISSLFCILI